MKPLTRPSSFAQGSGRTFLVLAAIAIGLSALAPIYLTRFLPINDYPFHLARMIILSELDNPIFARFYEQGSYLLPNIAMDALVVPLANFLGAESATRAFVELTLLAMLFGTMALHWAAHQRLSVWPLLAVALLHNGIFRFGFFNYLFGLGLAFAAAALWLCMRKGVARLATAFVASLVLILCHMEAFGVYALIAAGTELHDAVGDWRRARSWAPLAGLVVSASPFVLTLVLFFLVSPTAGVAGVGFHYNAGWLTKPVGGLFTLSSGILWLDAVTAIAIAGLVGWLFVTGRLVLSSRLAVALALLTVAFFALPATLMDSLYADTRLGPAIALLAIAALDFKIDAPRFVRWSVVGLALLLALVRSSVLSSTWASYDTEIGSIVNALDAIEPGATLFAVTSEPFVRLIADTPEAEAAWRPPVKHVASYAVLHAPIFVPMTFADPTKQPLNVSAPYQPVIAFQQENPAQAPDRSALAAFFGELEKHRHSTAWPALDPTYVLVMGRQRLEPMELPATVARVAQGDRFVLLELPRRHGNDAP